jgi:hypothetical protein
LPSAVEPVHETVAFARKAANTITSSLHVCHCQAKIGDLGSRTQLSKQPEVAAAFNAEIAYHTGIAA